jgi:hypothetical protein
MHTHDLMDELIAAPDHHRKSGRHELEAGDRHPQQGWAAVTVIDRDGTDATALRIDIRDTAISDSTAAPTHHYDPGRRR